MDRLKRDADKQAFWQLAISEQRRSGLSVRGFCRREGLSEASFYSWRRTLAERASEAKEANEPSFVQVTSAASEPQSPAAAASSLEVVLPGGAVVRVPMGFDAALLRQVVEVLS